MYEYLTKGIENSNDTIGKASDMDAISTLFALRFVGDIVELYIEDDESWFYKCSFHKYWVEDLLQCVTKADKLIGKVVLDFPS